MNGRRAQLTFGVLVMCGVGQQRSGEDMHAVFVEEAKKFCLLGFLKGITT